MSPLPDKLGLALSGGGFRAAFFHIGVLAHMAETGFLRKVEVISTVSGGSIIGALYYLHLKTLLEEKADGEISDADYRDLVAGVEAQLREAVRRNIRGHLFSDLRKNFRMGSSAYSRSNRIGELYDDFLYQSANARKGGPDGPVRLNELPIEPFGTTDFNPGAGNPDREDKAPIILLNATSLNTGHAWRFEAVRMGERLPQDKRMAEIVLDGDKNMHLEQGYFGVPSTKDRELYPGGPAWTPRQFGTDELQNFPLGVAVAASACVPGIFQPVTIQGAYEGVDVQLVDGGVHDNQGVQGLLDEDCTHIVISDGSGQMKDQEHPATRIPAVAARSMKIPVDSIRDEQLVRGTLQARKSALMHLRKGLDDRFIAPGEARDDDALVAAEGRLRCADFRVNPKVQAALSEIRTDLDFFSRTEASSLELDGYRMSRSVLVPGGSWAGVSGVVGDSLAASPFGWAFNEVGPHIDTEHEPYLRQLVVGAKKFFRPLRFPGPMRSRSIATLVTAVVLALALVWLLRHPLADLLGSGIDVWVLLAVLLATAGVGWLYLGAGTISKGLFTLLAWPLAILTAIPLYLYATAQVRFWRRLARFDEVPERP